MSTTAVYPPRRGKRNVKFSGLDDTFWTTRNGDITSELREPRRSLWLSFKNVKGLGRRKATP